MSFKQYRNIDLAIFLVLYGVLEYAIIKVGDLALDQAYTVSLMLPLQLLVMMRWDVYAIPQAVVSAILYVFYLSGINIQEMIIYVCGNLMVLLLLVVLKKAGKEKIRDSFLFTALYVIVGFILMQLGRFIAAIITTQTFKIATLLRFIFTDSLTLIFSLFVVLIARNVDGLFEDQKTYLLNFKEKQNQERRDAENSADYY